MSAQKIPATLIPGDGIGPEVTAATLEVLGALGAPFEWDTHQAGVAGVQLCGDPLPPQTLASIRKSRLALKGPLATPIGGGFRSSNVRLREEFQLYANLRPARTLVPGGRYEDIDLVLVRENLEGLYVGFEHYVPIGNDPRAVAMASGVNTLQYNLYTTVAFASVFGDGTVGTLTAAGIGAGVATANTLTVFGNLPDSATNQAAVPGNYSDTILVTVTY